MSSRCEVGENNLAMKRQILEMGWDQIPRFIMRMVEIAPQDKLVFTFILNRIRDFGGGRAFPSVETICKNVGLPERTVERSTASLVEIGLLVRKKRGLGKTNEYGLPVEIPEWILDKYGADWTEKKRRQVGGTEAPSRPLRGAKLAVRSRVGEGEHKEGDPSGACCRTPEGDPGVQPGKEGPVNPLTLKVDEHGAETPGAPQEAGPGGETATEAGEAPKPPAEARPGPASPAPEASSPKERGAEKVHVTCTGGSGKVMPWDREDEKQGLRRRSEKPKVNSLYDPDKPVKEWNGNDLVGYFRHMFKRTWPGEGAPDIRMLDLASAKRRLVWMRSEKVDLSLAKKAVDHLFEFWSDGLPSRLHWGGSRPGLAIVTSARLFEILVREVQNGVAPFRTMDEWKGGPEVEKYQKKEEIRARLMREGLTLEQADREADRLAGL